MDAEEREPGTVAGMTSPLHVVQMWMDDRGEWAVVWGPRHRDECAAWADRQRERMPRSRHDWVRVVPFGVGESVPPPTGGEE